MTFLADLRQHMANKKRKQAGLATASVKAALEDLLRARRLTASAPPLRGEDRRGRPVATGIPEVDSLLGGGFPRGQLSEVYGRASSGRTGLAMALLAAVTRAGSLAAWVDPADRFDPASAEAVDLGRLLWVRGGGRGPSGPALPRAVAATGGLLDSGLFDLVVLDVASAPIPELTRLPGPTWARLQRAVAPLPTALVLLAPAHLACGPGGVSLALGPSCPRWSGGGPGRVLHGLGVAGQAGRFQPRRAGFELRAFA